MKRFLPVHLMFMACLSASAQSLKVGHDRLANHAFYASFKQSHDPEFSLTRRFGLPGDGAPNELSFFGWRLYPRTRKRFSTGAVRMLSYVVPDTADHFQILLDPAQDTVVCGKTLRLVVEPGADAPDTLFAEVYMPLRIELQGSWAAPVPDEKGRMIPVASLGKGEEIRWNADPRNTKGVYISLHFDSRAAGNERFPGEGARFGDTRNWIWVADTGSVHLPSAMFNSIPKGAVVELMLYRGNWDFLAPRKGQPTKVPFVSGVWTTAALVYKKQ